MIQTKPKFQLTKSRYVEGTLCSKRLWLQANRPELAAPSSIAEERIMEEGTRVGMNARETLFPDGVLVQQIGLPAVEETQTLLAKDPPAIFEATFWHDGVLVMCDLLINNGDGTWDLMEVKASTRLKNEFIHDVAIQAHVLFGAGIQLRRQLLLLINSSDPATPNQASLPNRAASPNHGKLPSHANLYIERDVTNQVSAALVDLPERLAGFHTLIDQANEPPTNIGNHCQKPYLCPFKSHCWQGVPEPSIFSIPRLNGKVKTELAAQGILHLADLPEEYPLGINQQNAVRLMLEEREEIDREAIQQRLQTLAYPIYFFDFETDAPAIPRHRNLKPYEQVPFQYSCHILTEDGALTHREYLHTDQSDPRRPLLEALLADIGPTGSVVVYNASFERGVLRRLAKMAPETAVPLQSIIDRLWDQLELFKHHYKSYRFGGSNSIKKVLPVVAPHLSYSELTVSRGDQAQAVWNRMIETPESADKRQMIDDLLAYCKLDTLAMVEIQRHLEEICSFEMA